MSVSDRLRGAVAALLGVSAFEAPPPGQISPEEEKEIRQAIGGQIQPLPTPRLRWYIEDVERAQESADMGNITLAAQLCRAMNRDGTYKGLMNTRTKGLIRLPKRFYGDAKVAAELRARNGSRSVFDEMHPPSELQSLDRDGINLGIGVGEYVPVEGRDYPVLVRLEPEFLTYRWNENRWYFASLAGLLPITPGDGRWVLHIPGGRLNPWSSGLWYALGRSFVNKEHAIMYRANYLAKLANPARVAIFPSGASEQERGAFFRKLLAWGINTVFGMPPGWDVKLLESNGRGWEVFQKQIETCDQEMMIALAGQILTTVGGTGFDGQDVAQAIRQDLIQSDGEDLAYTINTQGIPSFIVRRYGVNALGRATLVEWDTGTPTDKERETRTLGQSADAIARLTEALAPFNKQPDADELMTRFGVPTKEGAIRAAEVVANGDSGGSDSGGDDSRVRAPVGRPVE